MSEKSLEMRHFRVLTLPEEAEMAPSWAAGVAQDGKDIEEAPTEVAGCIIEGGQEPNMGILDHQ